MELHQLRYFCAVASAGNFTRAAEQENVSQPSLSQQVLKLEGELGARLFERLGRRVRLTEFGAAFLQRAQTILQQVRDAKVEVSELAGAKKGEITLGVIPTVAPYFLPTRLADFAANNPQVTIRVVEDVTATLLGRLQDGAVDLALLALPVPGPHLICEELVRDRLFVVVPKKHRFASRPAVDLKELENEPFLLLKEGHCFRENVIAACRRSRLQPNVVFESGQFSSILALVGSGMGLSVIPEMAVAPISGCRFIPLVGERSWRRIGLVRLRNHYLTRAQNALAHHLRASTKAAKGPRRPTAT